MARKKVTSVPALADWGAVDNALRDIRECQHTLAEMAVQRDRQIDSIKADYAQGALPLQNRVKALESEVKAYVDLHRAELDGKRDSFERIARNQRIVEEYNGDNLKALAKKYNLTTVTVRAIVDEKHREIRARPLDGQMSFFPPERKVKY